MNLRQYSRQQNGRRVTIAQAIAATVISISVIALFYLGAVLCQ